MSKKFIFALALGAFLCDGASPGGGKKRPGEAGGFGGAPHESFVQTDTGKPPPGKPWTEDVWVGDWIQFHVVYSATEKAEEIRDLKVGIEGGAVEKMAVLRMTVRQALSFERNGGGTSGGGTSTAL